jgi:hypothetical protein
MVEILAFQIAHAGDDQGERQVENVHEELLLLHRGGVGRLSITIELAGVGIHAVEDDRIGLAHLFKTGRAGAQIDFNACPGLDQRETAAVSQDDVVDRVGARTSSAHQRAGLLNQAAAVALDQIAVFNALCGGQPTLASADQRIALDLEHQAAALPVDGDEKLSISAAPLRFNLDPLARRFEIFARPSAFERHQAMAQHQKDRPIGDRFSLTQIAVGQRAADNRHDINQRGISPVDQTRLLLGEQEMLGEIKHQQTAHAVIGKPLPHLSEEQDGQAFGMAKKAGVLKTARRLRAARCRV